MHTIGLYASILCLCYTSVQGYVLYPIKDGPDTGMVFVAGAGLYGYQYEALAIQIQEVYPGRLWVYLSNITLPEEEDISLSKPEVYDDDYLNNTHVGRGKLALYEAGMSEEAPVYAGGHSAGGALVYSEVEYSRVDDLAAGVILVGATMWSRAYDTYPVPVIAINGDLDGMMRVSEVALDYRIAYDEIQGGNTDYVYRYPHVMMEGVNHGMYVTGDLTDVVMFFWIEPEVTDEQSRQLIAEAAATFIVYQLTGDGEAQTRLENYNADMKALLPPIYQAFDAEISNDTSPWAKEGQTMIADLDDGQSIEVYNEVVSSAGLRLNDPVISSVNTTSLLYTVHTYTSLFYDNYVSATAIECKYKSRQAILEEITGVDQEPEPSVVCRDINQAAWDQVYNSLPELSLNRYLDRNITVTFYDDISTQTVNDWYNTTSWFRFNSTHLSIRAVTYLSETDGTEQGGMHHCKLASPARIMEFFYIDALYDIAYIPIDKDSIKMKRILNAQFLNKDRTLYNS